MKRKESRVYPCVCFRLLLSFPCYVMMRLLHTALADVCFFLYEQIVSYKLYFSVIYESYIPKKQPSHQTSICVILSRYFMTKVFDKEPSKMVEGSGVVESPATLSLYIKQYIQDWRLQKQSIGLFKWLLIKKSASCFVNKNVSGFLHPS